MERTILLCFKQIMRETVFITGAGFIGFHLIQRLVRNNINVVAVDNLNFITAWI